MHTKPSILLGLAAVLALSSSPASAQAAPATAEPPASFKGVDRNDDGLISSSEHEEAARTMFDAMDDDGDDSVTTEEMEASHRKITGRASSPLELSAAQKIRAVDTNADGVLSATEHSDGARKLFQQMDYDSDGNLSPQEFDAGRDDRLQRGG